MAATWFIGLVFKVANYVTALTNFLPTSLEIHDTKKERVETVTVGVTSWLFGLWKRAVAIRAATASVIHVNYRYNNRTFTYITKEPIRKWPPLTRADLNRPRGFDEHAVLMLALMVGKNGVIDVLDRVTMAMGPLGDFHGQTLMAIDILPDMHPHGVLCINTFEDKYVFKATDVVRL